LTCRKEKRARNQAGTKAANKMANPHKCTGAFNILTLNKDESPGAKRRAADNIENPEECIAACLILALGETLGKKKQTYNTVNPALYAGFSIFLSFLPCHVLKLCLFFSFPSSHSLLLS